MKPTLVREFRHLTVPMTRLLRGDELVQVASSWGAEVTLRLDEVPEGTFIRVPDKDGPWVGEVVAR